MPAARQPPSSDRPPSPADLQPRFAALGILASALERRGGLDDALGAPGLLQLEGRDRAFARALAMAALRGLGPIDRALRARIPKPPPSQVQNLLRIGAAQIFRLKTPPFAAVATTVAMADAAKATRPFKGLINAVLRSLAREGEGSSSGEDHAPPWLFARWRAAYGAEAAAAIAAQIPVEPATDLTLRDAEGAQALAVALDAEVLAGGSLRTARRGELSEWPGYAEGGWWVQDAAAAVPARLLDLKPGMEVLDLCAAPGGKTLQIAASGARATALDRSEARLRRLSENLARAGLTAEVVQADAASWPDERTFDAVLLDAPCSATGTFRRHPDVLWSASPADIAKLAALQSELLAHSAERVRPGGRLLYCVCSLEPEEGEAQSAAFLRRRPDFAIDPPLPLEGGAPLGALTPEGALRVTPALLEPSGSMDGFFIARFRRRGTS